MLIVSRQECMKKQWIFETVKAKVQSKLELCHFIEVFCQPRRASWYDSYKTC